LSQTSSHIAAIRKDYVLATLDETVTGNDPIAFFQQWFTEAEHASVDEVNAMTLATVDASAKPHARIVLLKGLDDRGFTFFTNYNSAKGHEMAANQHAALVFFWKELERQVRIEGIVEQVSTEESDQYFHSRPAGSRLGAWASPQSQVIKDRNELEELTKFYKQKFEGTEIPRPQHWGGYRLIPEYIEFWQGRSSRLHDRISFTRTDESVWVKNRLAP
jgi:pyridoxamine 5'-phosphate oxidase